MKQILVISSLFLVLISVSMIGYHVVSANEKVEETKDQITAQADKEKYLTPYGYTLDNPNIILDPYGISPLTAMILFETKEPEEVTIIIYGKDKETTFTNTFKSTTQHIIPIYGLYPDTENQIQIKSGNITKTYTIKTETIPQDIDITNSMIIPTEGISIQQTNNYIYGIDKNQDIRWLYKNNTSYLPYLLKNGHLLIDNTSKESPNISNILMEIDFTGKIYKQYHLENNYAGLVVEKENSLFILSKNLIELDRQTATILDTYSLDNTYEKMLLDETEENLILINKQEERIIHLGSKEQTINLISQEVINDSLIVNFYIDNKNYKIQQGIKFQNQIETEQSKKNIFLVGYKDPDKNYKKYNIEINQTTDNIQISGEFSNTDEVYIILDKFLDKRIYELKNNYLTIQQKGLSGKYSIYMKINDIIYKTNTYVKF